MLYCQAVNSWSRTIWLALVCVLGGLLGAFFLGQWAAPFRAGDTNPDLGPNVLGLLLATFLVGVLLGVCQWWLVHRWISGLRR